MTEKQLRDWIKKLIFISKEVRSIQDTNFAEKKISRLLGYIESLENIDI